ncbi:MAG: RnfABCDGE type electron transport complex subunit G [Gammaproteobacteria bacterium]|nr:RnfABCDGE type electron transport complex subunit G [Gammaproteobacteria bacterium]
MVFSMLGTVLVAMTHEVISERIRENLRQELLRQLNLLVPAEITNNDLSADCVTVRAPAHSNTESTRVYRGRKDNRPVAVVFSLVVAQGYGGSIDLVIGVRYDGTLPGVRVLRHKETPGLGDKIDTRHSDWILGFNGRSLDDPGQEGWKVKRDGGYFDQFTGANKPKVHPPEISGLMSRWKWNFSQ